MPVNGANWELTLVSYYISLSVKNLDFVNAWCWQAMFWHHEIECEIQSLVPSSSPYTKPEHERDQLQTFYYFLSLVQVGWSPNSCWSDGPQEWPEYRTATYQLTNSFSFPKQLTLTTGRGTLTVSESNTNFFQSISKVHHSTPPQVNVNHKCYILFIIKMQIKQKTKYTQARLEKKQSVGK